MTLMLLCLLMSADAAERPYGAEPLSLKEFRGAVPEDRVVDGHRMEIWIETEMCYRFRYRAEPTGQGVTLRLTELQGYAVFLPEQSWHVRSDEAMLEYARGYFDLAQIWSLRAAAEIREEHREEPIAVTAASRAVAEQQLQERLDEAFGVYHSTLRREQDYFVEATDYGRASEPLARVRQRQRKTLAEFTLPAPTSQR